MYKQKIDYTIEWWPVLSKNLPRGSEEGHVVIPVLLVKVILRTLESSYLFINVSSRLIKWSDFGYNGGTRAPPPSLEFSGSALNNSEDLCGERLLQANSSCGNFLETAAGWLTVELKLLK
jgi:hypothetical protein